MKRIALFVGLALLGGACARSPDAGSGMTLVPQGQHVAMERDGVWQAVSETVSLSRGDRVKVSGLGQAFVQLPGGTLELRRGSVLRIGTLPELESGSLLALAESPLSVAVGPVQVRAEGSVYRLDRSFSLRVGVYRGEVSLPGSGWDGTVGSLRQVGVVGGIVPRGPVALQVDSSDPWDDRLLGDAVDVGERLDRLQQGVADQLPARGGKDAVAAALRPESLDPRTVLRGIPERATASRLSEALVASIVAEAVVPGGGDAVEKAFAHVMDLRGLGASWIVVAAEWQLASSGLASFLEISSFLRDLTASGPPGPGSAGPGGAGGSSTEGSTDGGSDGGATEPSPPPEECPDLVGCTIEEVLDLPPDLGDAPLP